MLAAALAAVLASVAIGQPAGDDPADPLALYDANENGVIDADEFIQATVDYFDGLIGGALAYRVWLLHAPPTRSVTTREWSECVYQVRPRRQRGDRKELRPYRRFATTSMT